MADRPIIQVKDLAVGYGSTVILRDINFDVRAGEILTILGGSGSGKSTLLKHMIGLNRPLGGSILIDGTDIVTAEGQQWLDVLRKIGVAYQSGALFGSMTILSNIALVLEEFTDLPREAIEVIAQMKLKAVGLQAAAYKMPSELSGGMRKRVAIARAIAMNPQYLFCDEPNSGLDPHTSGVIDHLIQEITAEYEITTIVNTHDMNSVLSIGDSVAFVYKGQFWWRGDKETILHTDNEELNEFVFGTELTSRLKK